MPTPQQHSIHKIDSLHLYPTDAASINTGGQFAYDTTNGSILRGSVMGSFRKSVSAGTVNIPFSLRGITGDVVDTDVTKFGYSTAGIDVRFRLSAYNFPSFNQRTQSFRLITFLRKNTGNNNTAVPGWTLENTTGDEIATGNGDYLTNSMSSVSYDDSTGELSLKYTALVDHTIQGLFTYF
jgi:hypothetical protein